jgi:hypothetical protein
MDEKKEKFVGIAVFLSQLSKGARVDSVVDTDPFPVGSASFCQI